MWGKEDGTDVVFVDDRKIFYLIYHNRICRENVEKSLLLTKNINKSILTLQLRKIIIKKWWYL